MRIFLASLLLLDIRSGRACEVLNPSDLSASYALGSNTVGLVWFEGTYTYPDNSNPPFNYYWSGIIIGAKVDTNGNVLTTYLVTPMHAFAYTNDGESVTSAGTGNYYTQNGLIFSNLTAVYQSPLWNPNSPNVNAGDIAIFSSTSAVPTNWIRSIATNIPWQNEAVVTSVGYGFPSTPDGTLASTGNPMGFNSLSSDGVSLNVEDNGDYFSGLMDPGLGVDLNGAGNDGNSGSIVLNQSRQIVGMAVAATGSPTGEDRATDFENWAAPNFYNQIAPYAGIIVSPPTLNSQTIGTNLVLSWAGPFVLQSSTNAAGGFADITNAASPYTNAMTAPQMSFRLRSTP